MSFIELLHDLDEMRSRQQRQQLAKSRMNHPPAPVKARRPKAVPDNPRFSATKRFQSPAPPPVPDLKKVLREQEKLLRKCLARTLIDRYDLERQRTDLDPITAASLDALVPHLETARRLAR